ncbi:Spondin-1 [Gracilariopsis chorda]|uniref:Spondin-1 n=1 Tax=Gracilariopsis chorda TaxID=448386 RepID=A0A2V3IT49_9FLOR|nr:Spondin-1 [Gracilariopsis chorda]|eukprot:PXF45296.1 Spondin-1 [Gracilariopsis chorda]
MMRQVTAFFLVLTLVHVVPVEGRCSGRAVYRVSFHNLLTPENFGKLIPQRGLVFSPLVGASHSHRISFLTVRGFASRQVEQIAETGDNSRFVTMARNLRSQRHGVLHVAAANGPTLPGKYTTLFYPVDCAHPFITMLGMIAPSPDWIVQINNRNMLRDGKFVARDFGTLIAYDAGTDDGREFTIPADASVDKPSEPQKNIAPLVEDETDRFQGRIVGRFLIQRIR